MIAAKETKGCTTHLKSQTCKHARAAAHVIVDQLLSGSAFLIRRPDGIDDRHREPERGLCLFMTSFAPGGLVDMGRNVCRQIKQLEPVSGSGGVLACE